MPTPDAPTAIRAPFNIYGPRQKTGKFGAVIPIFASRVRGRSLTSQRLEESLSWVGYNLSLVLRVFHEFGMRPLIAG